MRQGLQKIAILAMNLPHAVAIGQALFLPAKIHFQGQKPGDFVVILIRRAYAQLCYGLRHGLLLFLKIHI